MSFDKRWEGKKGFSYFGRLKNTIKSTDPLKSRLLESTKRIDLEKQRLDQASIRFQERDKMIFNKIVDSYSKHDSTSANVYANELAEVRKMEKMILHAKLALEQISLRMKTITELGDVAVTLLPIIGVISDIKSGAASISPQAEKEMSEIGNLLSGIVVDASAMTGGTINFESVNEDSSKILDEAQTIAESRMTETFPELPRTGTGQTIGSGNDTRSQTS